MLCPPTVRILPRVPHRSSTRDEREGAESGRSVHVVLESFHAKIITVAIIPQRQLGRAPSHPGGPHIRLELRPYQCLQA